MSQLLKLREKMKKKRPTFLRQETHRVRRFKDNPCWRKPAGKRSKMRTKEAAKQNMPDIGWRGPKAVRGFHPTGLKEVIVHNVSGLEGLAKDVMVKISATVGQKKKLDIVKYATQKGYKVANPALSIRLRNAEDIAELLPVKAFCTCTVSPKVSEEERKGIEEAAEKNGIRLEASA